MTNSNSIYQDTTDVSNDVYLVYVLYRDGNIPHYVGATIDTRRPYSNQHHARKDHTITSVEIVQECMTLEDAGKLEDQLINHYGKSVDGGTLINQRGGGRGLITHSEETKAKIGQASKGRTLSDETKQKMSLARKGRTHSEEAKLKMSLAKKGRTFSDEHKAKIGRANKGRTHTDEAKVKIGLAKKGRPSPLKGRTLSDEHKAKLSAASKGKKRGPHSAEQKAKMSAAQKARWAERRKDTSYG